MVLLLPLLVVLVRTLGSSASIVRLSLSSPDFPAGDSAAQKEIKIRLRPDLSGQTSTDFVQHLAGTDAGGTFKFYRAERWGVLQGEISHPSVPTTVAHGPCPADIDGVALYKARNCFAHDPNCGCHGPTFTEGMVGWAGGAGGGPHFFIYADGKPATHWSHDHTVWGEVADAQSLATVKAVLRGFPIDEGSGMAMLVHPLTFTMHMEGEQGEQGKQGEQSGQGGGLGQGADKHGGSGGSGGVGALTQLARSNSGRSRGSGDSGSGDSDSGGGGGDRAVLVRQDVSAAGTTTHPLLIHSPTAHPLAAYDPNTCTPMHSPTAHSLAHSPL
jgi:hypothetical protein